MNLDFMPAVASYGRKRVRVYRAAAPALLTDDPAAGARVRPLNRPSKMPQSTALLLDAAAFASTCHQGQRRKHVDDMPYINHPLAVAREIVVTAGVDNAAVLAAALLHDVIEDADVTVEQLRERFGPSVAEMVVECTDDGQMSKKERKAAQVEHAPGISPGAKLIKLADKLCNVRDLRVADDDEWSLKKRRKYLAWANEVVTALGQVNEALERAYWEESRLAAAIVNEGADDETVDPDEAERKRAKKEKKKAKKRAKAMANGDDEGAPDDEASSVTVATAAPPATPGA